MTDKIQIGDSIWCDKGFGFIVERIEQQYNPPRQIYYGTITGQEIYIASEVARKIEPQENINLREYIKEYFHISMDESQESESRRKQNAKRKIETLLGTKL